MFNLMAELVNLVKIVNTEKMFSTALARNWQDYLEPLQTLKKLGNILSTQKVEGFDLNDK